MIRMAACDDNELLRDLLKEMLEEYAEQSENEADISMFGSAESLIEEVRAHGGYDIYILDIVMPGMNGMEAAVSLRSALDEGIIIFLSASMEYAVKSYDVGAFYYLMKPVEQKKLFSVLDNACEKLRKESDAGIIEIKTENGKKAFGISEIAYINIEDRSVCYHLKNGETVSGRKLRGSFSKEASDILEDRRFSLCGTATVINMTCIDDVDDGSVLLRDGTLLYPSKSACAALRKQFLAWKK